MSYYSEDDEVDVPRPSKNLTPPPSPTKQRSSPSTSVVAGAIVAGVTVLAAVGAHFLFKKKPAVAPQRPSAIRSQRRKVPPRRARSTASGASSVTHSPPASASGTPVKASRPNLPPRKQTASKLSPAPARTESGPSPPTAGVAAAAAAAATIGTATAAIVKHELETVPEAAAESAPPAEETAAALAKDAASEIERLQAAATADQPAAAVKAAEELEDTVDDQLTLAKGQAQEAVLGVFSAAVDAVEAEAEAQEILNGAKEPEPQPEPAPLPEPVPEPETPAVESAPAAVAPPAEPEPEEGLVEEEDVEEVEEEPAAAAADSPAATAAADGTLAGEEAEAAAPPPDEDDDQVESLDAIPHPSLSFESAPGKNQEMNAVESKARDMSVHAHKLVKENNKLLQGLKEQQAALDLVIGPEGAGQVRPNLVAACCFALADMLLAQQRVSETKVALATAYEAAQHIEDKGAVIRALMNYAYVVRHSGKPRSARNAYTQALELARSELGACHPTVEQVKYEYTAYLAKVGRTQEAADILAKGAEELMAEGDRLEKEAPADAAKANGSGAKDGEAAGKDADPGSGLEHIAAEAEAAAAAAEEETLPPAKQARHFAMRNLMNAAGLLDNLDEHDKALETLNKAMDIAISVHGENSVPHMNTLYAIGVHCKRRGALQDALTAHETVLNMMDETIQVYEPEMLQNRVSILRDTALLYDQLGDPEGALDYAQGALVNAQTLSKIMAAGGVSTTVRASMMEPFWLLLADLKAKTGDVDGAAEAKREALRGKLNQGRAARGGRAGAAAGRTSGGGLKRAQNGAGATRAGGRRV